MVSRIILIIFLHLISAVCLISTSNGSCLFSEITTEVTALEGEGAISDAARPPVKETPIPDADLSCRKGMMFVEKGLKEDAVYNFKIATGLYKEVMRGTTATEEGLVAIRENLEKMSKELGILIDANKTVTAAVTSEAERTVTELPMDKTLSTNRTEPASKGAQDEPTARLTPELTPKPTPELLAPEPTPFARKLEFRDASEGEYWVVESTTLLWKVPEVPGNEAQLLGNLVTVIGPETVVRILEVKETPAKWVKVRIHKDTDRAYVEGWISSDMIGEAREIDRPE